MYKTSQFMFPSIVVVASVVPAVFQDVSTSFKTETYDTPKSVTSSNTSKDKPRNLNKKNTEVHLGSRFILQRAVLHLFVKTIFFLHLITIL